MNYSNLTLDQLRSRKSSLVLRLKLMLDDVSSEGSNERTLVARTAGELEEEIARRFATDGREDAAVTGLISAASCFRVAKEMDLAEANLAKARGLAKFDHQFAAIAQVASLLATRPDGLGADRESLCRRASVEGKLGVFLVAPNGRTLDSNEVELATLGFTRAELGAMDRSMTFADPNDYGRLLRSVASAPDHGEVDCNHAACFGPPGVQQGRTDRGVLQLRDAG